MTRTKTLLTSVLAVFLALAFSGCASMPSNQGTVSFFVRDAPSDDFDQVIVTIHHVEVHRAGGDDNATDGADDMDEGDMGAPTSSTPPMGSNATMSSSMMMDEDGWLTIVADQKSVDLKQFQGDARAFIGSEKIPEGKYTQIRLHVSEAHGVKNGNHTDIAVTNMMKIVKPWSVAAGKETALTVDFELSSILVKEGNGGYRLKPTLKLSVEDDAHTGHSGAAMGSGEMSHTMGTAHGH